MTFRELLEELEFLSVDVDTEVEVKDFSGNALEIAQIDDTDGKCVIYID